MSYLDLFKEEKTSGVENLEFRRQNSLFKALHEKTFYALPFGLPRYGMDITVIDRLYNTPQIHAVGTKIKDMFSSQVEEIIGGKRKNRIDLQAILDDPNSSNTSWQDEKAAFCVDWLKNNNGVMQKIFTRNGEFTEIRSISSSSIFVNYNKYGMLADRRDIISSEYYQQMIREATKSSKPSQIYGGFMQNQPAYFQYMYYIVPFGWRELIFNKLNQDNRDIYGKGRVEILYQMIQILLYGSDREVDRYLRNDMPVHGVMALKGGNEKTVKQFRAKNREVMTYWDDVNDVQKHNHWNIPIVATAERGGVEFVTPRINDKEMQAIEKLKHYEEIVWMVMGMNANAMGRTDAVNKATSESQEDIIMEQMIMPLLNRFANLLTQELCLREFNDPDMKIRYNFLNVENENKKMELYQKYVNVLKYSVDELREIENLDPLGGKYGEPPEDPKPPVFGKNQEEEEGEEEFYAAKSINLNEILGDIVKDDSEEKLTEIYNKAHNKK